LNQSCIRRELCRLCDQSQLDLILPLASSPIADAYVSAEKLGIVQNSYPLDLYLCRACGHVQNIDVVNPEILFRDYVYKTSHSLGLVDHYRDYAEQINKRFEFSPGSLVVELGSNDGSLLGFFKSHGYNVLGIDPAKSIASDATQKGIPTLPEFFNLELAENIRLKYGAAKIVAANNVFAHADDLQDITLGISHALDDDGVFIFEVSYLPDIVDRFLFDTVYHEHVSYHSLIPLVKFFKKNGLELFDVQKISSKGGSIRGFAQKLTKGNRAISENVNKLLQMESERGFDRSDIFNCFSREIDKRKTDLLEFIDPKILMGKTFAGYGASTTVTTLLWHFELTERIQYLVDDNPAKQGLYAPKCHLPVISSEKMQKKMPDYIVILAWNYAAPIIAKNKAYLDAGGTFIIPLPELRLIRGSEEAS
jgi:SAM-dependent methyltransferase